VLSSILKNGDREPLPVWRDAGHEVGAAQVAQNRDSPPESASARCRPVAAAPVTCGTRPAFTSRRGGEVALTVLHLDGSAPPTSFAADSVVKVPTSWTPDGASIVFSRVDPEGKTGEDVYIVQAGGALIVYEAIIDDARSTNAFGLMMSLNMLIETPGGFDYTGADCIGWMKEAGFSSARVAHLLGSDSMVVGIK
jgi:hypothetical protein